MNILIYILIFLSKILENALATLRMILISNGKKQVGAILQLIIAFIWILSTSAVIVNIIEDPFKVIVFCLGSYVGSLFGSIIEEKMALGSNLVMVITDIDARFMVRSLRKAGFAITSFKGKGKENFKTILIILVKRKLRKNMFDIIKKCDDEAMIIVGSASAVGGFH